MDTGIASSNNGCLKICDNQEQEIYCNIDKDMEMIYERIGKLHSKLKRDFNITYSINETQDIFSYSLQFRTLIRGLASFCVSLDKRNADYKFSHPFYRMLEEIKKVGEIESSLGITIESISLLKFEYKYAVDNARRILKDQLSAEQDKILEEISQKGDPMTDDLSITLFEITGIHPLIWWSFANQNARKPSKRKLTNSQK